MGKSATPCAILKIAANRAAYKEQLKRARLRKQRRNALESSNSEGGNKN